VQNTSRSLHVLQSSVIVPRDATQWVTEQRLKMNHVNVFFLDAVFNSATSAVVHKHNVSKLRNMSFIYF
jgi:hypothetical protein